MFSNSVEDIIKYNVVRVTFKTCYKYNELGIHILEIESHCYKTDIQGEFYRQLDKNGTKLFCRERIPLLFQY